MSVLQEAGHIKNMYYIYSCFDFPTHSMFTFDNSEVAWVLVSLGSQAQPELILHPDYLSVSYDYVEYYRVFAKRIKPLLLEPQLSDFYHLSVA